MRKLAVNLIVGLCILGFVSSAQAMTLEEIRDKGYIRVGLYPELAPFTFRDSQGGFVGFDVDLIKKVAQMWGVRIKWVPIKSWPDNIPGLERRRFDLFIGPMTITVERALRVAFTLPHFNAGQVVVVSSDNTTIKSHEDLIGKKISVDRGSSCEQAAFDIKGAKVVSVKGLPRVIDSVLQGETVAAIMDRPIALAQVKEQAGRLKIAGEPFTIEYYGYCVNREDTELFMQLNQALTIIKERGIYNTIIKRWF